MSEVEARIENLAQKLNVKFMVRKELKKLPSMLYEHENVLNLVNGRYEGNEGLIVVTDRRVMFIDEGVVRSHREDFPYERISSVQCSTGMMSGKLVIFASGNKAELDNILPKQQANAVADRSATRSPGLSRPARYHRHQLWPRPHQRPTTRTRSCASSASCVTQAF